jgi:ABC-2 type transport system permease protein
VSDYRYMAQSGLWLRRLQVMTVKELLQLVRDTPRVVFFVFSFSFNIVMGGGRPGFELKNAVVHVLDHDKSATSREYVARFKPPFYVLHGIDGSPGESIDLLDRGDVMVTLDIPTGFEKALRRGESTSAQMQVDTTNSSLGLLAASYAQQITGDFGMEILSDRTGLTAADADTLPVIRDEQRAWFNPNQNNAWFFSISELLMMTTLLTILLSTAAMAREKERGTIEQLLVSPLSPVQILLPKVMAMTLVVVLGSMVSVFGVLIPVFHLPIKGSLPLFFALTALYGMTSSGLGLFIATVTRNLSQAGMLAIFTFVPIILFSGIHTPDEGMPGWLHTIVLFNPLAYYIDATYSILLRGAGLDLVWDSVLAMALLGGAVLSFGVWRFRRQFG